MSAYLVATYKVLDPEMMGAYQQAVFPTIQAYGGKVLVAGQPKETVEGEFGQDVIVVLEFDSVKVAKDWYNSESYQKIMHLRHDSTITDWSVISEKFALPVGG